MTAILGVAACGSSPCDRVDGACLGLRITSGPQLDQLAVSLSGAVEYGASTPSSPGPLHTPPLETAIELPDDAAGTLQVDVVGLRAGIARAHAEGSVTIVAGGRRTIQLALETTSPDGGLVDLGNDDLTGADLANVDHADLAHVDLAGADLSAEARYLFVLPLQVAAIGDATTADQACTAAAQASSLDGSSAVWHALIGYSGDGGDPFERLDKGQGRPIVLPDGTSLWPSGDIFTGTPPAHDIDELSTGEQVPPSCVWTGFGASGTSLGTALRGKCGNWTYTGSDWDAAFGYVGTTGSQSVTWALTQELDCSQTCHVFCLEE